MMRSILRWYLVQTKPSNELVACSNLERQGYEIYYPRVVRAIRRGRQAFERIGPLFPRYVFLRLREGQQALGPVRSSLGVASVVRFGPAFAVVPDHVIVELKSRADSSSGLHRLRGAPPVEAGAPMRVVTGPLTGLEGIFDRQLGTERVVVLLNFLGRETPTEIPRDFAVQA
jgi:transcriptional antiterminator RfaH